MLGAEFIPPWVEEDAPGIESHLPRCGPPLIASGRTQPHQLRLILWEKPAIILRIALPVPLPELFDYLPPAAGPTPVPPPAPGPGLVQAPDPGPDSAQDDLVPALVPGAVPVPLPTVAPGMRVQVPFGAGVRVGMIVALGLDSDQPLERLKPILALIDDRPLLGVGDLALILWAADYYRQPPGEALFAALPARLRRAVPLLVPPSSKEPGPGLTALGKAPATGPELNAHQDAAVSAMLAALGRFQPFLLEGVTGSGKTEVYLRLLLAVVAAGGQALLLVPEIGLTPQLRRRLEARLPGRLVTLHSGLSATARELAWQAAVSGAADLVLGTRSAVFTPLPRLRLILVDEEHDLSFKQQDGFRYSARDLAVRRAQQAGCPLVLGSATPSLESLRNVALGRYARLELPERAGGAAHPAIGLLDIRGQPLRGGLSQVLIRLMREQFAAGNQVLLFLNRRGFAPVLTCHDCGWVGGCPHCDARLTLHLADNRLWCHHCGLVRPLPPACPQCGGLDIRPLGQGTERLEGELQALFPDIRVARVDRDSTRRKGELDRLLAAARAGEYSLLVGTQMLAKGHHFPRVTLVGILDADNGLYGADFRAAERMAQLVIQVAGRAGRAERPGRVVLQTHHPDHPLLQTLRRQGYAAFASAALRERRAAGLPPFSHQALLRAEGTSREAALGWLRFALEAARPLASPAPRVLGASGASSAQGPHSAHGGPCARGDGSASAASGASGIQGGKSTQGTQGGGVSLFGPVPAPMERRAGRFRAQLLVQAHARGDLQGFLAGWIPLLYALRRPAGGRWSIDVDPQELY